MGDTSIFGATSPILGKRYRFEVSPTFGDVNFTGILADYRHYVMPVRPYTFAFRFMHFGRYGGGEDDDRLQDLFVGYPTLVRGYDVNSFSAGGVRRRATTVRSSTSCWGPGSRWPTSSSGSRPSARSAARGSTGRYPSSCWASPTWAWPGGRGESVKLDLSGADGSLTERQPVRSVGVGARVNLFGYAVLEVDYAKPLDRPGKGWLWVFNLSPGF